MVIARFAVLAAACGSLACSGGDSSSGRTEPGGLPHLDVHGHTGTTNAEPQHAVYISDLGSAVHDLPAKLEALAFFEPQVGEGSVTVAPETDIGWSVRSAAPRPEGWNAFGLRATGEFDTKSAQATGWQDSSGTFRQRFYVGSAPYVLGLCVMPDEGKGATISIAFSEQVALFDFPGTATLMLDGAPATGCFTYGVSECLPEKITHFASAVVFRASPGSTPDGPFAVELRFPASTPGAARSFAQAAALADFAGSGATIESGQVVLTLDAASFVPSSDGSCWLSPLATAS